MWFGLFSRRIRPPRKAPSPEKLRFERVTLDVTPANLLQFIRKTALLRRSGFRLISDFTVEAWPETFFRAFMHEEKPLYALIVEDLGADVHIEFLSFFDDMTSLLTSGSEEQPDPSRPASLIKQTLPGFTTDELYMQHLLALEDDLGKGKKAIPPSRRTFFEDFRANLVLEHELRHHKHLVRAETLQALLETLPALPLDDLIGRYDRVEPLPVIPVPPEKPTIKKQAPEPKDSTLERRISSSRTVEVKIEEIADRTNETSARPQESATVIEETPNPAIPALLPFQRVEATPEQVPGSTVSTKPTCPHCGATLFSSLSSRCSKCKQSVR